MACSQCQERLQPSDGEDASRLFRDPAYKAYREHDPAWKPDPKALERMHGRQLVNLLEFIGVKED